MLDAQKPDHISLQTLLQRLREGRYVVPDFQRDFEWEPWDIRNLVGSVFRDYYIGSLLLWRGKADNFDALSCEPLFGRPKKSEPGFDEKSREFIVLDGQQRLTALHYAFVAPDVALPNRSRRAFYFVYVDRFMDPAAEEDAFSYEWASKRMLALMEDETAQFDAHFFPCQLLGQPNMFPLYRWLEGYQKHWDAKAQAAEADGDAEAAETAKGHADNALKFGEHVQAVYGQYQISYVELDRELALDKVCDIFTQINSRGVQLDVFDLMNALLKPKGLQLRFMWRDAAERLAFPEAKKMNVYVLQVMSILRQYYCSPRYLYYLLPGEKKPVRQADGSLEREVLIPDEQDFKRRWDHAVDALERTIARLRHPQEFGVVSSRFIPYVSILPTFAALQAYASDLPAAKQLGAERKIRHWYWASVFLNRYSGSVESTATRDFQDVRDWIDDDAAQPAAVGEFNRTFRQTDLRTHVRSGQSIYNAVFNLFVLAGARDWVTGQMPTADQLDDHHIVPQSWNLIGNDNTPIHTILNRAPLTSKTNRHVISDRLPNQYLPELIAENGEPRVREILESHFISPKALEILLRDPFSPDDYEAFLTERQRTIFDAIEALVVKERLGMTPVMRDLDEAVERTEIALRKLVAERLGDDPSKLPGHIAQKLDERITRASRKDPIFDAEAYESLLRRLEMADLRELQDTIVAKPLWPEFAPVFKNKETLIGKFGQLAELRNGIAHNRSIDDVTRQEGDAAIRWFAGVIG